METNDFTKLIMVNLEESGFDTVKYLGDNGYANNGQLSIEYKGKKYVVTVKEIK